MKSFPFNLFFSFFFSLFLPAKYRFETSIFQFWKSPGRDSSGFENISCHRIREKRIGKGGKRKKERRIESFFGLENDRTKHFGKHLPKTFLGRIERHGFSPLERHVPLSFDGINPRMDRKIGLPQIPFFFFFFF